MSRQSLAKAHQKIQELSWEPAYHEPVSQYGTDYTFRKAQKKDRLKQVLRSYFPMQEEKDHRVYGAQDGAIRGNMSAIERGGNPVLVKRGIDIAVNALVDRLQTVSHPVSTEEDYARVASISANDDYTIGRVVAKALHTVGDDGVVTVDDTPLPGVSVDFVEDFEFDNGYVSPYMAVTVGTQLLVPAMLRRVGHRPVLVAGSLLLGLPTPLLALTAELGPVLAVSAVRGIGFGMR